MVFGNKMVAIQKLPFVRLWTFFVRSSRENGVTYYDETFFSILYMREKVVGYLGLSKWWPSKNLILFGYGRFIRFSRKNGGTSIAVVVSW